MACGKEDEYKENYEFPCKKLTIQVVLIEVRKSDARCHLVNALQRGVKYTLALCFIESVRDVCQDGEYLVRIFGVHCDSDTHPPAVLPYELGEVIGKTKEDKGEEQLHIFM